MRRLVIVAGALAVVLFALSLRSLSTAEVGDEPELVPSLFASPIDPPSRVTGTVFDDTDGDGEIDESEPGLEGVTVALEGCIDGMITTDPIGRYSFCLYCDGSYTVTLVTPGGYTTTTEKSKTIDVTGAGEEFTVNFGCRASGIYLPLVARTYSQ